MCYNIAVVQFTDMPKAHKLMPTIPVVTKKPDEPLVSISETGARSFDINRYLETDDGAYQLKMLVEIEEYVKKTTREKK